MPRLDDLPPDLRATLSLLVDRGKSYAQVAELLGIPERAVRDRAHAALDALAGAPGETVPPPSAHSAAASSERGQAPERPIPTGGLPGAYGGSSGLPVSRRGGALLLAGIVVAVVVVVVLLTSGGGGSHQGAGTSTSASTTTPAHTSSSHTRSTTSGSSKGPAVTNQIRLSPPASSSKAIGLVEILREGSQRAFYIAAEHLPPSQGFSYVIWLYNSPSSAQAISKAPTVGSNGRLQGGALLPSNASAYRQILLTRETSGRATQPGPIVLSGAVSLNK